MKLIDAVWAAVAVDEANQIEGLCAVVVGDKWMPLVAADETRLEFVREEARRLSDFSGQTVRLIRLYHREIVETFTPGGRYDG